MNCKPGDLAVIVVPGMPADGMIVQCVKYLGLQLVLRSSGPEYGDLWQVDREVPAFDGCPTSVAEDEILRPIRDPGDDAKDESLAWLPPVPSTQKEFV